MSEHIVGLMFSKNEADILPQIIEDALPKVDSLFIADDGSDDASWSIIQAYAKAHKDKIEHIRQIPDPIDKGQRQALLDKIRKRYKPENTWVQLIESDVMILDTDIRAAIATQAVSDLAVTWTMINACRFPGETWREVDTYPFWGMPLKELMPKAHYMEHLLYTFRPLPKLIYDSDRWRPYPRGFGQYVNGKVKIGSKGKNCPLLLHLGYRGPTHFHLKFKKGGPPFPRHSRYPSWDMSTPETVLNTVSFFNDTWNKNAFAASRLGWATRKEADNSAV